MSLCHQATLAGPKGADYNSPAWQHLHGLRLQPPGLLLRTEMSLSRLKPFFMNVYYSGLFMILEAQDTLLNVG